MSHYPSQGPRRRKAQTTLYGTPMISSCGCALTAHKAMSLRYKFGENMKGDSKCLISKATFGFCFANVFVCIPTHMKNTYFAEHRIIISPLRHMWSVRQTAQLVRYCSNACEM